MNAYDDDPLGGYDDLDPRQQAAVRRMSNRARRYESTGYMPTNRDRWAAFQRAEADDETYRFRRS